MTETTEISRVAVVGLGTMGAGIAEVFARAGYDVVGVEQDADRATARREAVAASLRRAVQGGKISEDDAAAAMGRLVVSARLQDCADADLVVEAIPENITGKRDLFVELDAVVGERTILATNTSSLSVTELAVATRHPNRVAGLHFSNPAPVIDFVEVVRTVVVESHVIEELQAVAERLGRASVVVGDRAGFIANSLLFGYLNHAVRMCEARYASREDIDAAMVYGCGYPMGPLALLDLIGIDTAYEILRSMYKQSRNRLHAPAPMLKQMVSGGLLGRKSGQGFYTYAGVGSAEVVPDALTPATGTEQGDVRDISRVGVVGSGTMATGIVEVFAKNGYDVVVVARSAEKVENVRSSLASSLDRAVSKGRLSQGARDEALAHVTGSASREALADVDLVVEAVVEDLEVKRELFADLDAICKPGTILATTTSSLPVVECAAATSRPGDVVGIHFFNPAQIMKLVEVVTTVLTDDDVARTARALSRAVGKHPVTCGDRAGFIVNALLFPYLNDAISMLEAHYATADDIDMAMKKGCRLPMGPFALLDVVGLDVSLAIEETLYEEFSEPGFAPSPLLEHMVTAGYLGRKTGRGFRDYSKR